MSFEAKIVMLPVNSLQPYAGNARTHSRKQVKQIAKSIERFGFTNPLLISDDGMILAGHGRLQAAKLLGYSEVPAIRLSHLSPTERRAYMLADNKLALNASWDQELLAVELQGLTEANFDVDITGFSPAEIDICLDPAAESSDGPEVPREDCVPEAPQADAITLAGDVWLLGRHRLLCGDARRAQDYTHLLEREQADMVFTDPPYNVPVDRDVSVLEKVQQRECAAAVGEMTYAAATQFLRDTLGHTANVSRDGATAFVCTDWRHMRQLLAAGQSVFSDLKNLCIWNKSNGEAGSFYRSKHELVFVFCIGATRHLNAFGPGETGRHRTNVWDYAGVNTIKAGAIEERAIHTTVKPVALVADAIRDCSRRGDVVLDPFGRSGTTLVAAEMTGRKARLIEHDPIRCDVIVRRFEQLTGKEGRLKATGETFERVSRYRAPTAVCPTPSMAPEADPVLS